MLMILIIVSSYWVARIANHARAFVLTAVHERLSLRKQWIDLICSPALSRTTCPLAIEVAARGLAFSK